MTTSGRVLLTRKVQLQEEITAVLSETQQLENERERMARDIQDSGEWVTGVCSPSFFVMGQCLRWWVSVWEQVGQCLQWCVNVYNCGSVFGMRSQYLWLWVSVCNSGSVCTIVGQCLHWLVVFVMVGQCLQWCVNVCDGESVCLLHPWPLVLHATCFDFAAGFTLICRLLWQSLMSRRNWICSELWQNRIVLIVAQVKV